MNPTPHLNPINDPPTQKLVVHIGRIVGVDIPTNEHSAVAGVVVNEATFFEPAAAGEWNVIWLHHDPALPTAGMVAALTERIRQVAVQRYDAAWDDVHHPDGSLIRMAADIIGDVQDEPNTDARPRLATAAAFVIAEIDRLNRVEEALIDEGVTA